MAALTIRTHKKKEIIDITDEVESLAHNKPDATLCMLFIKHTTAALTTADLDPGTDLDMLDAFEVLMPRLDYRHPHNPAHAPDHILSSIIGPSLTIPISNGELELGTWQRVIVVELDGPREREIEVRFV
ncbi:MAG TPA: secondary thiamine-phosphate synthase enzyme YjbQ [Candidatus Saccharimonadales bacterium]|nr:secondary thiamine-phosphate synthase enzyme YjbQ [Candidatus Saccharimonadales bacterium]